MKELKNYKQVKKKPWQFLKIKKKHKNVQHNREQIRLLREGIITEAKLFIINNQEFKEVTIIERAPANSDRIVYLSNDGKNSKLKIGTYDGDLNSLRCKLYTDKYNTRYINWDNYIGLVVKEEVFKEHNV